MPITAVLPLSFAMIFSANAVENESNKLHSASPTSDNIVYVQCTEVKLEYKSGGTMRETQSQNCATAARTIIF
ncbi:MAG: hypothetical protein ABJO01_12830 [Parasphingorhabdus sp.]|uniref:hypothetical protein n=1 Tax=Parasphingorhabdus sp. TaxID=2709688 RepID=UPI00329A7226